MNRQTHTSTETTTTPHSDETWRQSTWSHDNSGNEWSVGQLVDYSMVHGQLTKVMIDDIKHNFTPGAMDNPPSPDEHDSRVERADLEHPIVVVKMPDGSLVIGDGFHRTEKAMKLGHKQIDAYVIDFSLLPPPDIQNSCGHDDTLDLSAEDIALRKRVFDTLDNRAA